MAKHKPSVVWLLRRLGRYPNGQVSTADEKRIQISVIHAPGYGWRHLELTRRDARLLAKRINQCLDDTK